MLMKAGDPMYGSEKRIRIFEQTMRVCAEDDDVRRAIETMKAGQRIIW